MSALQQVSARDCAQQAAKSLRKAASVANQPAAAAADVMVHVSVGEAWRQLGETIATNLAMTPLRDPDAADARR